MVNSRLKNDKKKVRSGIQLPKVIFGTSELGNLQGAFEEEVKCEMIKEWIRLSDGPVVFDAAGKYGAGIALETLGKCLRQLNIPDEKIIISNKLGWLRKELKTPGVAFSPKSLKSLKYDAVQKISYDGIMECFEQGNKLLGGYFPQMVAIHYPDEYFATAQNWQEKLRIYEDILGAFEALFELKHQGMIKGIGVEVKDWSIAKRITDDVPIDWIMIAESMTKNNSRELMDFLHKMDQKGVSVINSLVFQSGFSIGEDYYDYMKFKRGAFNDVALLNWRKEFFAVCEQFDIKPAAGCVQFALHLPGVSSVVLNTTNAAGVKEKLELAEVELPAEFWEILSAKGLIHAANQNKGLLFDNKQIEVNETNTLY